MSEEVVINHYTIDRGIVIVDGRCSEECNFYACCKGFRTTQGRCPEWILSDSRNEMIFTRKLTRKLRR